jgi:TonB family protein
LRAFTPPPQPQPAAAPPLALSAAPEAALAIVGLDPVKTPDFPMPPGSRPASFSTGPQPRAEGGESAAGAMIVVPGLLARGGVRDQEPTLVANVPLPPRPSQQALLAAARNALGSPPAAPAPSATRVSGAPDPRLEGRAIYTLAIQMPNVTSYTGSWIVWFAERQLAPGSPALAIAPPVPLRKVDPKYIAAAADERVEGTVRLFAVIRKDGRVDSVVLLRHLDDRLDRSAQEALAKWEFTPASRDGAAVEVDAVF